MNLYNKLLTQVEITDLINTMNYGLVWIVL
uniref:Uncharacterized protein n=1 Tax=Amphimedon queenslandica TaxID=400682 RepID=A0A1X7TYQ1_AMPQE